MYLNIPFCLFCDLSEVKSGLLCFCMLCCLSLLVFALLLIASSDLTVSRSWKCTV